MCSGLTRKKKQEGCNIISSYFKERPMIPLPGGCCGKCWLHMPVLVQRQPRDLGVPDADLAYHEDPVSKALVREMLCSVPGSTPPGSTPPETAAQTVLRPSCFHPLFLHFVRSSLRKTKFSSTCISKMTLLVHKNTYANLINYT